MGGRDIERPWFETCGIIWCKAVASVQGFFIVPLWSRVTLSLPCVPTGLGVPHLA